MKQIYSWETNLPIYYIRLYVVVSLTFGWPPFSLDVNVRMYMYCIVNGYHLLQTFPGRHFRHFKLMNVS